MNNALYSLVHNHKYAAQISTHEFAFRGGTLTSCLANGIFVWWRSIYKRIIINTNSAKLNCSTKLFRTYWTAHDVRMRRHASVHFSICACFLCDRTRASHLFHIPQFHNSTSMLRRYIGCLCVQRPLIESRTYALIKP